MPQVWYQVERIMASRGGTDGAPIDYIFVSPEWRVEQVIVDREKTRGGYPSDHYPLVAKLTNSVVP